MAPKEELLVRRPVNGLHLTPEEALLRERNPIYPHEDIINHRQGEFRFPPMIPALVFVVFIAAVLLFLLKCIVNWWDRKHKSDTYVFVDMLETEKGQKARTKSSRAQRNIQNAQFGLLASSPATAADQARGLMVVSSEDVDLGEDIVGKGNPLILRGGRRPRLVASAASGAATQGSDSNNEDEHENDGDIEEEYDEDMDHEEVIEYDSDDEVVRRRPSGHHSEPSTLQRDGAAGAVSQEQTVEVHNSSRDTNETNEDNNPTTTSTTLGGGGETSLSSRAHSTPPATESDV